MSENDIDERQFLKSLQEQPVPGQDLPADEISPMKFPVFCTADIPAEVRKRTRPSGRWLIRNL